MRPSNDDMEGTEHCSLLSLESVAAILQLHGLSSPSSSQELVKVILYGDERLPIDLNKKLLEATLL